MKKIKYIGLCCLILLLGIFFGGKVFAQNAPSYNDNFSKYLTGQMADAKGRVDSVYNISQVSADRTFEENVRCLFYPNHSISGCGTVRGGLLWGFFRYVGLGLFVLFLCVVGVKMVVQPDKAKDNLKSLLYILYGGAIFFGSTWILGSALDVGGLQGTDDLIDSIQGNNDSIGFKVVAFFKTLVFFLAIIMIVIHGFKAMSRADKTDKAKEAIKGIVNVVVALVIVKVIDYLYFIVQAQDFVGKATSLIVEIAKIFGFIVGALLVLMVFYAGFLFITDGGKGESMKKATKIIVGIVLVSTVIFLLLLIMYQIFAEFA